METAGFAVEAYPDQRVGKVQSGIVDEILVTEARKAGKIRKEAIRAVAKAPTARSLRGAQPGHEPATHGRGALLAPQRGVCDGPAITSQVYDAKVREREQAQKNRVGKELG